MVVNGAQLASYSQAKEVIVSAGYLNEGIALHFCASMISGLLTTIASMPVDIVKTRVQKSSGQTNPIVIDPNIQYSFCENVIIRKRKKSLKSFDRKLLPIRIPKFRSLNQV